MNTVNLNSILRHHKLPCFSRDVTPSSLRRPHPSATTMEYAVDASEFTTYWRNMLFSLYATSTTLLLYGIYALLFILSLRTARRPNASEKRIFIVTTYTMFLLATAQMILWFCTTGISVRIVQDLIQQNTVESSLRLWRIYFQFDVAQNIVFVINNCATDLLFLYRCYIIWGSRWRVITLPALCILVTVVLGIVVTVSYDSMTQVHYIDRRAPFIMNVVTNAILVCLTAGRVWWMQREIRILIGAASPPRYAAVVSMILESGSIYWLCLILQVVAQSLAPSSASSIFLGLSTGLTQQVVNIAPTLLVVRAKWGDHDRDQTTKSRVFTPGLVFRTSSLEVGTSLRPTESASGIEMKRTSSEVFEA
ncbi:hypothetical protein MSAN_00844300 [Mycena sanguinolenta]|uniref:Uncharacterized protein n=1 Tax=Mycena sanguinolenta TaxID=230812 RepID=A0A8H6YZU4_9AGAR|nr:hypothetical protein MSAN_00844300 [Mycena sanguinolenta]